MKTVIRRFLEPLLSRLGTAAATFLVASGMSETDALSVNVALVALALLGIDFLADLFFKEKAIQRANKSSESRFSLGGYHRRNHREGE